MVAEVLSDLEICARCFSAAFRTLMSRIAAVLVDTDEATARAEAGALVALARTAGLVVWGGYATLATGWTASDLISAAEAALELALQAGPGTLAG